jgi:hypothetical protein
MARAMRGNLHPIAAPLHAAPSPVTVPGAVVKVEAAGGIRAPLQPRPITIAEKIARRLRDRPEKLIGIIESKPKLQHETRLRRS